MNKSDSDGSVKTPSEVFTFENPPSTIMGILGRLGPGMIIAGSIVGSGELIATTLTGATAGFWLLWLIIVGCVIKVFVQVEFGRYTISSNQTTMAGLNEVPGPVAAVSLTGRSESTKIGGNWLLWYWAIMFAVSLGQLGGIVGGVGQALAISLPLTERGRDWNEWQDIQISLRIVEAQTALASKRLNEAENEASRIAIQTRLDELAREHQRWQEALDVRNPSALDASSRAGGTSPDVPGTSSPESQGFADRWAEWWSQLWLRATSDDKLWAAMVTLVTIGLLVRGRYNLIQTFATVLVASFTLITLVNLFALQAHADWAVRLSDLVNGLSFRLPPSEEIPANTSPLVIALATFGIIGVGANELIAYPYWCQEKGYARFTGPRDETTEWARRARGWMRVLEWDAWCSMIVYTFATVAFYLLGAAILGRIGLVPGGMEMVRTLGVMYEPVFGNWAKIMFLFGAFAVLYSTFFVANAGYARIATDALGVMAIAPRSTDGKQRWTSAMCVILPTIAWLVYVIFPQPTALILAGGAMQALMLPRLAVAALHFRYHRCDPRLSPGRTWDVFLWVSVFGLMITGGWLVLEMFLPKS